MVSSEQLRAQPGEPVMQVAESSGFNRRAPLCEDGTGIETGVHFHDGDARFASPLAIAH
jgi:hypothetical protein